MDPQRAGVRRRDARERRRATMITIAIALGLVGLLLMASTSRYGLAHPDVANSMSLTAALIQVVAVVSACKLLIGKSFAETLRIDGALYAAMAWGPVLAFVAAFLLWIVAGMVHFEGRTWGTEWFLQNEGSVDRWALRDENKDKDEEVVVLF